MTGRDILVLLRDCMLGLTWFVAMVFLLSGCQDLIYDIGAYTLRIYRRVAFRGRERLTLEKLRMREQQRIAVMVPACNEGEVVAAMVNNIIQRVEYKNYLVFVGTYPNDAATQSAVDRLAKEFPQIIKVVTPLPGPTTKADCLNNVYKMIKQYEERHDVNFDIIVMHDAEDVVHPHSFLLYNYLIPRVDVMQLPILPLPTHWRKLVHWSYADEFSETHMKDVPVREKISGFVPYAGTGTGFSRRVFRTLEQMGGYKIFNEDTMTEDYSMSKRIRETGFTSIFVNLVLAGGDDKWYTPLCKRTTFIANWAYFPMDFHRAVRQKTRWIIGISLQEWELGGWTGSLRIKENLLKDRKVFVAAGTSLLGYVLLAYFIVFALGDNNVIGFKLLPIIDQGSKLQRLVMVDTFFMFFRMFQRVVFVGMVYGLPEGLMSVPRLVVGNVINGLAAFRALQAFARARQGKAAVRWDNTQHVEGVGELPSDDSEERRAVHRPDNPDVDGLIRAFDSRDIWEVIHAMEAIPRAVTSNQRTEIVRAFYEFVESREGKIRSMVARISGYLAWEEMAPPLLTLLHDKDWAVRANAAKALLKQPNFDRLIEAAFVDADIYVRDLLVKVIEQDSLKQDTLIRALDNNYMITTRTVLLRESLILRTRYEKFKQAY